MRKSLAAFAVVWSFLGSDLGGNVAHAGFITSPAGLVAGDTFRIVFVTDGTTTATSSDISIYNNFVTAQANGETYDGTTLTWSAIASTATVSAIANIGTYNVPVYLSNGTLVSNSDGTTGMFSSSSSLTNPINTDLSGTTIHNFVWTGSDTAGQNPLYTLGSSSGLGIFGDTRYTDIAWIDNGVANVADYAESLYGISEVLTVPETVATPEPSSFILVISALPAGLLVWRRGRR